MDDVRIDKWLWAARFFRTRSLAQSAIERGQVLIASERVKLSRAVRIGDRISIRIGDFLRVVEVLEVSAIRRAAPEAQNLYRETPESVERRVKELAQRALQPEPAQAIEHGRPTKRERRALDRLRRG